MSSTPEPSAHRPLNGAAKLVMMTSAAATIIVFYIFISLTILGLGFWIGCELIAAIIGVRVGLTAYIGRFLERHFKLLSALVNQLWLREGTRYRLKLEPSEAPGIVAIMNRLAGQLNIQPPDTIYLEMTMGAWVELRGLRREIGKTHLGIGYDLLAGLTEQEIEAVLAHELVHAKLVKRAFSRWLKYGLHRAGRVNGQLSAISNAYRRAGQSFTIAEGILQIADRLTHWCAQLVAAYSRQDEFEADYGAAELCGSAPLSSALSKLNALEEKLSRLPWSERLAHIQSDEGLSQWLIKELALEPVAKPEGERLDLRNKYSTHPSLTDRLAALPKDGSTLHPSPPGLQLLANPEATARKLVGEIQRIQLESENKDLKALRKWKMTTRQSTQFRAVHVPGILVGLFSVFIALAYWAGDHPLVALVIAVSGLSLSICLYRILGALVRRPLPILDYETFIRTWPELPAKIDLEKTQQEIEATLKKKIAAVKSKKKRKEFFLHEAYTALGRGDYLTTHVAARQVRINNKTDHDACLALAIASAAYGQRDQCNQLLQSVYGHSAFRSPTVAWGAAWACILTGSWLPAEALLHRRLRKSPNDPALLSLIAFCQYQRGKPRSALLNIRQARTVQPATLEQTKLLIRVLLDQGDRNEAEQLLRELGEIVHTDQSLQFSWIRLLVLKRQFAEANEEIERLSAQSPPPHFFVGLGKIFENAREDAKAQEFYQRALLNGHYPEALIGLSRLAWRVRDKGLSRQYTLSAFDTTKTLAPKARSIFDLFQSALNLLMLLEERVADCKAWTARIPPGSKPGPLANRTLLIYATEEKIAADYLRTVMQAMEPARDLSTTTFSKPTLAPKDLQPAVPVYPGIQYIYI